jgi:predicted GNAT family N-acyltransferase
MVTTLVVNFNNKYSHEIKTIRNSVFTLEQYVDPQIDFDGQDENATHVLVKNNDKFVGTGRILSDGHIGRIAVLKSDRGLGLGMEIVSALLKEAQSKGLSRAYLGSQEYAIGFYLKLGFVPYGDPYIEANIEHRFMEIMFK